MSTLLDCVEVGPADAKASVVWMHGLGANGHDFEPIVPHLQCPHVRFVFPHAPALPVTINGGFVMPAWYDILTLDHVEGRESEEHIRASAAHIEALMERERSRGVEPSRMVIAGFSQGAAMSLFVGSRHPHPLAGIMALSGYHVVRSKFEAERQDANRNTELFFGHGTMDPMVQPDWGREAKADFEGWTTAPIHWHEYPMGHEVCMDEIQAIGAWLRRRLPNS
ncbi:MAG: carboxylesterase [Myxococcota bacterium]